MQIDADVIRKVAGVAHVSLSDEEVNEFVGELKEVLESFQAIDEVDTTGLAPSYQPVSLRNSMRSDEVRPSLSQERALSNAMHKKDGYFMGPRTV